MMRFAFPIATAAMAGILIMATIRDPGPHHHPGPQPATSRAVAGYLTADVVTLSSPLTLWDSATVAPLDLPLDGLLSAQHLLDSLVLRHSYLPVPAPPLRLALGRFANSVVTSRPAWLVIEQHVTTVASGPPDRRPPPQDSDEVEVFDATSGVTLQGLSGPAASLPAPLASS